MKRLFLLLTLALILTAVSCTSAAALDKNEAKGIALEHAGLAEEQANGLRVEYDKDGKAKKFEIEFRAEGDEYEYEIDADTGQVLKAEKNDRDLLRPTDPTAAPTTAPTNAAEPIPTAPADTTPTQSVQAEPSVRKTADEAKGIAFTEAGVSEADVRELEVELECDDGREYYDIDFKVERVEYSYHVDAYTGQILKKEIETE